MIAAQGRRPHALSHGGEKGPAMRKYRILRSFVGPRVQLYPSHETLQLDIQQIQQITQIIHENAGTRTTRKWREKPQFQEHGEPRTCLFSCQQIQQSVGGGSPSPVVLHPVRTLRQV